MFTIDFWGRCKYWLGFNSKLDFCPSFTSSFTSLFTYIIIYMAFYSKTWFFSMIFTIIHIIIYLHHYLHQILQQNLNVKFTWFFTLIFSGNSCCLFTSIYTSKFTYNPKLIFRKMGWLVNLFTEHLQFTFTAKKMKYTSYGE